MDYQSNTAAIISFSTNYCCPLYSFCNIVSLPLKFYCCPDFFYLSVPLTGGKSNTLKNPVAFVAQNENNFVFAGKSEYSLYSSLRL